MNDELGVMNDCVKLNGRFLNTYTNDKSKAKSLVDNWYLEKAKEIKRTVLLGIDV